MAAMTARHSGHYQYWKPTRRIDWSEWSRIAWLIALTLTLIVIGYVATATFIMLANLPPEVPR